ncbi:hypothetical protein PMX22_20750 [Clostridium butyricum]|jgi:hypothetical protein|uniref:hypothetical protein n=1 Tax=Clostridium butyricum TaxID=1492 RepID=UPI0020460644|nr:hypothetical protein [Clostridium butyricum]MDB2162213.1 hypothetical protein [Clostridium butyricum]DAQ97592.1 MAG TPA: putative cytoplasmic protein [Caudoviricetes sp.]
MTQFKSQEDYIKEIAEKINNGKRYEIENPTLEDILKLNDYDYIITEGFYFPLMIRKRYKIDTVLNIPTVFWYDGYEIGDTIMGMIPHTFTAEEILGEIKGFKGTE